jgi:hypothetical protein
MLNLLINHFDSKPVNDPSHLCFLNKLCKSKKLVEIISPNTKNSLIEILSFTAYFVKDRAIVAYTYNNNSLRVLFIAGLQKFQMPDILPSGSP